MAKNKATPFFLLLILITGVSGMVQPCSLCLIPSEELVLIPSGCVCSDSTCPSSCVEDHEHYSGGPPDTAVTSSGTPIFDFQFTAAGSHDNISARNSLKKPAFQPAGNPAVAVHISSTVLTV
ncbi:MAG: hypothetical protein ACLFQK_00380 [Fibrobacterota bacterium]